MTEVGSLAPLSELVAEMPVLHWLKRAPDLVEELEALRWEQGARVAQAWVVWLCRRELDVDEARGVFALWKAGLVDESADDCPMCSALRQYRDARRM